MSDEQQEQEQQQNPGNAPTDDGGDDSVTLTKAQAEALYESGKNSAWAEARRHFERQKQAQPQPTDDPRVKRGLELLSRYERAHNDEQNRQVEQDARMDALGPFGERVTQALSRVKIGPGGKMSAPPQPPAQQPAAGQQSEIGQLLELMRMDIASRMADKLPKAPVQYASPMDGVRADINAQIADIPKDDPQHSAKVRQIVMDRLKHVKVTSPDNPNLRNQMMPTKPTRK